MEQVVSLTTQHILVVQSTLQTMPLLASEEPATLTTTMQHKVEPSLQQTTR